MKNCSLKVLLVGMMNIFAYGNVQAVTMSERINSDIAVQKDSTVKKVPRVMFTGNVPPTTPGAYQFAYNATFVFEGSTGTLSGRGDVVVSGNFSSVYLNEYGLRLNFGTWNWREESEKFLQDAYKDRGVVSITVLFQK